MAVRNRARAHSAHTRASGYPEPFARTAFAALDPRFRGDERNGDRFNPTEICSNVIRRAAALACAALCAACASVGDPFGYSMVAQDKYDFHDCARIKGAQRSLATREKTLSGLVDKAEAAPGGFVVGALAYRTELASVRAERRAADRAAQINQCDALRK